MNSIQKEMLIFDYRTICKLEKALSENTIKKAIAEHQAKKAIADDLFK
ncbi:hypothetical protein KAR34_12805 [bacterium]|nr:hypothetical protein [bacterium]